MEIYRTMETSNFDISSLKHNREMVAQSITHTNFKVLQFSKLHYFQFAFLENCVYKKQKKSIKDQRNFCSNTFFNVFANFVSAHSKI